MADKKKGGRYTPPKSSTADEPTAAKPASSSIRRPRRPLLDERARAEMAKRPQSLRYQFTMSGLWIVAGIATYVFIPASWKVFPALFLVAIGLFSLRGAIRTSLHGDSRAPGTRTAAAPTTKITKPTRGASSAKGEAPKIAAPRARRRGGDQDSSR